MVMNNELSNSFALGKPQFLFGSRVYRGEPEVHPATRAVTIFAIEVHFTPAAVP
jgi:hypothetical protein